MDIAAGIHRLNRLGARLRDGSAISEPYAEAVGAQAKRNASRRVSPQSPMAGSALVVRGSVVSVPSSAIVSSSSGPVRAGAIAGGSEYGSSLYRQFGPRSSGKWLHAAADRPDSATLEAGEDALAELVAEAVR